MIRASGWSTAASLRTRLKKRWIQGKFLSDSVYQSNTPEFPLRMPIKGPTPAEMADRFSSLREWIANLRRDTEECHPGLSLEWKEVNHRTLGRNSYPAALYISNLESLAAFLGTTPELRKFRTLVATVKSRNPKLLVWASVRPFELIENANALVRLLDIANWLQHYPRPGIYIRQLSLPGVDTKFMEQHKKVLMHILNIALPGESVDDTHRGIRAFEARYGFRRPPQLIRFRLPEGDDRIGGCSDLSVPSQEFATLPETLIAGIDTVYIVENDITALAFPLNERTMVIFGRGYHFDNLSQANWLQNKKLYYWGDIDTHGFAILNQFRSCFPRTRSVLMDRKTLVDNQDHWGNEPSQAKGELLNLSNAEALLCRNLRENILGEHIRLEQEFIRFEAVEQAVGRTEE